MPPKIIGIVGPIRSGKTYASTYLTGKYGYRIASNSEILREIANNLAMPPNRENLKKLGDAIFNVLGNDAIARFRLSQRLDVPIIIDGIRYKEEIAAYSQEPTFKLLGLNASEDVRYTRAMALAHEGKDQNIERSQFNALASARSEAQVDSLVQGAHVVLRNELDIVSFQKSLDQVMENWAHS